MNCAGSNNNIHAIVHQIITGVESVYIWGFCGCVQCHDEPSAPFGLWPQLDGLIGRIFGFGGNGGGPFALYANVAASSVSSAIPDLN